MRMRDDWTHHPYAMATALFSVSCMMGCSSDHAAPSTPTVVGTKGGDAGPDTLDVPASGSVSDIAISGLRLVPEFSAAIEDYTVRCQSTPTSTTLAVTDATGVKLTNLVLTENEAVVVQNKYWIRCLPADFPIITSQAYPAVGSPTAGWYLTGTAVFVAPSGGYAMVLDTNATPVWYRRADSVLDVESFAKNTLSFMPEATAPFGTSVTASFDVLSLDTMNVTTLAAAGGVATDGHELRLLDNGNHLVLTYPITPDVDLTGLGAYGDDNFMVDCQAQEVDPNGNLVWSWLASDHIDPVKESLVPTNFTIGSNAVVDVFHCNSIDVDATGNLLVSARHLNSVFYIDKPTGKIVWKLNGTTYNKDGATFIKVVSDSEDGTTQTSFSMQHDARFLPNGDISMYDDHGDTVGVARGVEYAIDHTANTATQTFQYLGTQRSLYMGSFRRYADGSSVIGWGGLDPDLRAFTEIDAAGNDVLDVAFPFGDVAYRAVKVPTAQLDISVLRSTAGQ